MESHPEEKHKSGIHALYLLVFNNLLCVERLPMDILLSDKANPSSLLPLHRRLVAGWRIRRQVRQMAPKVRAMMRLRFTDSPAHVHRDIPVGLGGRLEGYAVSEDGRPQPSSML